MGRRRRPTREPLLKARHRAARLAWEREHRDWSVKYWKRVAWSNECRFCRPYATGRLKYGVKLMKSWILHASCTSHKSRLAIFLSDEHSSDFSVINLSHRSPDLNPIELLWDVLEQSVKGHHTLLTNLTELWTALANIWQVIPLERFQKLVESIPRRVGAVIKDLLKTLLRRRRRDLFKRVVLFKRWHLGRLKLIEEWMSAHIAVARCSPKYKQLADEQQSPFVWPRCLDTESLRLSHKKNNPTM
ncbi:transposable element Tc1 transposase [Trichonephila clavipes]|nr:transposable element Tc1 transposase [Trichonephila clavipes]